MNKKSDLILGSFTGKNEGRILSSLRRDGYEALFSIFKGIFQDENPIIFHAIESTLNDFHLPESYNSEETMLYIKKASKELDIVLKKSDYFTRKGRQKILNDFQYRFLLYGILQILIRTDVEINTVEPKDVPDQIGREIYNILKDKHLTTLMIVLKSYGLLEYSKNIINTFEKEKEIKILEVDKESLEKSLVGMGAKKVFQGVINDVYYDYPSMKLDQEGTYKRSFRIRKRTEIKNKKEVTQYFYTIKRKEKQTHTKSVRICFEKEYKIFEFEKLVNVLSMYGLIPYRAKIKNRVSYSIPEENIKFDIDSYDNIPTLLEIECDSISSMRKYMKILGLDAKVCISSGSRGLYKHYGILKQYIHVSHNNLEEYLYD